MTHTKEPANQKSITSLQEEIDYLREENHAKTQTIKQLTDMKVAPSNSDITTGTCTCKVASIHTYRVNNNYKEPSIDLETNTKSKTKLDKFKNHQNKNITEKSNSDIINEKNEKQEYRSENNTKKERKKRTRKIKDLNMARKPETMKTMYKRKNGKLFIFETKLDIPCQSSSIFRCLSELHG